MNSESLTACYTTACVFRQPTLSGALIPPVLFTVLIDKIRALHFRVGTSGKGWAGGFFFKTLNIRLKRGDAQSLEASGGV